MTREEALLKKAQLREAAERKARKRTEELYLLLPELKTIDERLSDFGPRIVAAAMANDAGAIDALQEENLRLQNQRGALLRANGLREDEDAPAYSCRKCKDSGYVLLEMCDCLKSMLSTAVYRSAGLGKGLEGKTFEAFSLSYYGGEDAEVMSRILNFCKNYADSFRKDSPSLLFAGKTGLGKTHLSAAIAETVARKGYFVLYESSQKLFDNYEATRFGKAADLQDRVDDYETCDLLIIDDLGAECASQYTSATFFNLLNTRLINGMPTIISTNLSTPALEKTYGERILSRLYGEFRLLQFVGKDVRMQKIQRRKS